jgi:hypothetical protein
MSQQVHTRPTSDSTGRTTDDDVVDQAVDDAKTRSQSELVEHADEFLDEIDAILTEEEEFAVTYRQRGGQ